MSAAASSPRKQRRRKQRFAANERRTPTRTRRLHVRATALTNSSLQFKHSFPCHPSCYSSCRALSRRGTQGMGQHTTPWVLVLQTGPPEVVSATCGCHGQPQPPNYIIPLHIIPKSADPLTWHALCVRSGEPRCTKQQHRYQQENLRLRHRVVVAPCCWPSSRGSMSVDDHSCHRVLGARLS